MEHTLRFKSLQEKMNIWLDLCDFTFRLLKSTLSKDELKKRLEKIREDHLKQDYLFLSKQANLK